MSASRKLRRAVGPPLSLDNLLLPADYPNVGAATRGQRVAIQCAARSFTYDALDRAVNAAVTVLAEAGIGMGGRLALLGRNSTLFFIVLLASARAGAVVVPINWRNTALETRDVLEDSDVSLIICEQEFVPIVDAAGRRNAALLILDGANSDDFPARLGSAEPADRIAVEPHLPWLQLYTSGTTGRPKGVVTTQYAFACQRRMEEVSGHFKDWKDDEVLLSPLPTFHIGGMTWVLNGPANGQTTIITNDASPVGLVDACLLHGATRTFLVPTLVRAMITEMDMRGICIPSLRGIHYGAAAMDPALLDRSVDRIGCRFLQYYGMTEITGTISILGPDYHDPARPKLLRSVGKPLPGIEIEIRGPENQLLDIDEPGEIWVRSPSSLLLYWRRPEATSEALQDGWYRTGDGGRIDAEGFLFLTDRIKDMIVSGGENVYPAEVEAVLRDHPAVQDCAVFGLPHLRWGEGVTAAIELRPGHSVTVEELIAYARGSLAAYKIPRRIEIGMPLARTASGKVQRAAVRARFLT